MPTATWKIGRSTGICALTEQPLGPGDRVVVGLFEDAGVEGYLRRDHQATVWEETYGDQKPKDVWPTGCGSSRTKKPLGG